MSDRALPLLERGGYVVLERAGGLWGVAGRDVRRLGRRGDHLRLQVNGGELGAEQVVAVVPDLVVRPAPAVLRRFWPEAATGLAVYRERPVLVIDAARPPRMLLVDGEADGDGLRARGRDPEGGDAQNRDSQGMD